MADPAYMDKQNEIEWGQRATLVDWLVQIHTRYHLLPETLWIAINIIDRFLSKRVVSLVKLQLVGITAMFIAAKYEEIMAPSVDEFVFMTEGGYSKEEILKGERIILQVSAVPCLSSSSTAEASMRREKGLLIVRFARACVCACLFVLDTEFSHFCVLLAIFMGSTDQQSGRL